MAVQVGFEPTRRVLRARVKLGVTVRAQEITLARLGHEALPARTDFCSDTKALHRRITVMKMQDLGALGIATPLTGASKKRDQSQFVGSIALCRSCFETEFALGERSTF